MKLRLVMLGVIALVWASPAQAHWIGRCNSYMDAKQQLSCGNRAAWHGKTTILFLKTHPQAGTPYQRRIVRKAHHWLLQYGRQQAAQARDRMQLRQPSSSCSAPSWCGWQDTVNCENSGSWADSPGFFMFGLQFDPGSLATSQAHTGITASAWPPSQIVNAVWLKANSKADPWPNCPNP